MNIKVTPKELDLLELQGLSEQKIAEKLGCTRQGLYKYRLRVNCPQKIRSDKGIGRSRLTSDEKRLRKNKYQRDYTANYRKDTGKSRNRKRNKRIMKAIALRVLRRPLRKGEIIHHIDNDPSNNKNNNLVICTQSYHISVLHARDREAA